MLMFLQTGPTARSLLRRLRRDRPAQLTIVLLIAVNVVFLLAYILIYIFPGDGTGRFAGSLSDLSLDGSLPEFVNYVQALACAAFLGAVYLRRRQPVYAAWALVFLFVVVDDLLSVHERLGMLAHYVIGLPVLGSLRPWDLGELLVWSVAAVPLIAILIRSLQTSDAAALGAGGVIAVLFAGLVLCGVVLDMAHAALGFRSGRGDHLFNLLEDGGEMLMVSLASASAFLHFRTTIAGDDGPDA